jgi:hypothetical protein
LLLEFSLHDFWTAVWLRLSAKLKMFIPFYFCLWVLCINFVKYFIHKIDSKMLYRNEFQLRFPRKINW